MVGYDNIFMATTGIRAAVGRAAPFFKVQAWNCPQQKFQEVSLTDFKNKWLLLFFYPLDFTFVCPTEIIEFSNKAKLFRDTNCEVLGCSIDSHFSHMEYTKKPRADGGLGDIDISLLADTKKEISDSYGVLSDAGVSFRGSFIIDAEQVVRHISVNDLGVGRNVDEYLRLVKVNSKHMLGIPAQPETRRSLPCFMEAWRSNHDSIKQRQT